MATIKKKQKITSTGGDVEKLEPLRITGKVKMVQGLWKTIWQFLSKLKMKLPQGYKMPLLDMYLKFLKAGSSGDICTPVFHSHIETSQKVEAMQVSTDLWKATQGTHPYNGILFSLKGGKIWHMS